MARPSAKIDQKKFESLCIAHKSKEAICRELHIGDARTIDKWCMRTYSSSFSDILEIKKEEGNTYLIRNALELSKKNPAMCIFLLKNWCGYKDNPDDVTINNAELIQQLAKWSGNDKQSDSQTT